MKRIGLSAIFLLAFAFAGFASVVTPQRSADVAAEFFTKCAATKSSTTSGMRLLASYPIADAAPDEAPAFYVYGQPQGGFVVVAGDDAARPILGYSDNGQFPSDEEMPEGMRAMLQWYAKEIGFARAKGWKADASTQRLWADPAAAVQNSTPVLLETALWGQWKPFNTYCPTVNGQECPCGCVATAMGIIMRYHKWPDAGTGTLPGYSFGWNGATQSYQYHIDAQPLGHKYDWDAMPLSYSSSYSPHAGQQVGQLMFDLGVMSNMDYGPNGSGAGSNSALYLAKYFKYDKQISFYDRTGYINDEKWEAYIRNEIDAGRPVFYTGFDGDGGHAFVLDGYHDRYFHINYGWSGNSNYYYTVTPIDGHSEDLLDFKRSQDMTIRIMPDKGGSPNVSLSLDGFASFGWDFKSDTFTAESIQLYKYAPIGDGETEVAYCLFDINLNYKETLSEPFIIGLGNNIETPAVTCKAPTNLAHGDYFLLSRRDGIGGWEPLEFNGRISYNQFDKERSLSDMVSIGHTYGWVMSYDRSYRDPKNLFFKAFKDIYWEIRLKSGEVLMRSGEAMHNVYISHSGRYCFTAYCEYSTYATDTPYFEFCGISSGDYVLYFRNFDEEMTIDVKL